MRGRWHHDEDRIGSIEEGLQCDVAAYAKLLLDFCPALRSRLDEPAELDTGKIAKNSYVVEPKAARADDTNEWSFRQITTPRSLASTNRMSSFTSDNGSSSFCACTIACVTLWSDRNSNLYARLSSRIV